jgi:hypothetical protein
MTLTKLNGILAGNNVENYCSFEYPWFHALIRHVRSKESSYLVVPRAFGEFSELSFWLEDELPAVSDLGRLLVVDYQEGDIREAIVDKLVEGFSSSNLTDSAAWFEDLLTAYREENPPNIPPRVFLIRIENASNWTWLERLLASQQRVGVSAAICIVITNSPPPGASHVVRYSPPHLFANLERLPDPDRDTVFWNSILNSFIVVWESAGIPDVAIRLNEELCLTLGVWSDASYGRRRDETLRKYAQALLNGLASDEIARLKAWASPAANIRLEEQTDLINPLDVQLWHLGALQFQDGIFDITPIAARYLLSVHNDLPKDERLALERRRLNNAALARWISGWAATIEENLRLVVLTFGDGEFYKFLQAAPSLGRNYNSRYDELQNNYKNRELGPDQPCIVMAEASDMIQFVTSQQRFKKWQQDLDAWRRARNKVIHERSVDPQVIKCISRMVNLMRKDGFV